MESRAVPVSPLSPTPASSLTSPAVGPSDSPPSDAGADADEAPIHLIEGDGCPFLMAERGAWRLGIPSREHRCTAFFPSASLAPTKQARLCLTPTHVACATYIASLAARVERTGMPAAGERVGRWALARTLPVVEDPGGLRATVMSAISDRRTWPAVPAVLLVTTLVALGISGLPSEGPATAIASATPGPTRVAHSNAPATPAPSISGPTPTAALATTSPAILQATSSPGYRTTYRVRSGDTLIAIAARYNTTVAAISQLNGITDPSLLHIGQVLRIP